MQRAGIVRRLATGAVAAGVLMLGAVVVAPASGATSASTPIVWAEIPSATPNFIFPYLPGSLCSVANISQFQYFMYRPLYFFGSGESTNVNSELSAADQPTYTNNTQTVTVNLKGWKWSNGESVDAQDVLFWMNMYHAEPMNYCGYVPGEMPDNIKNVTASGDTVTFTTTKPVNTYWFTYNELSQITPLPIAWDVTSATGAPGSGGCSSAAYGTADSNCAAVYTFLSNQAGYNATNPNATSNALATYATNPLWKVVDGPWQLSSFNADGTASFVPNPKYSGPVKPTISKFTELPYTSDSAEFNALAGGSVNVGYLPQTEVTSPAPNPQSTGANNPRLSNFKLVPLYNWSITYFPINFNSTGDGGNAGKIFRQLYFRQAVQSLVDQPLYVNKLWKNYANPTYGPVPVAPANTLSTSFEKSNPYPYNPSKAKSLLAAHGWKVVPNGTDTCIKPGTGANQCGSGIPSGAQLKFNMAYATGIAALTSEVTAEKASWSSAGINVVLQGESFNTVTSQAVACPSGCSWEWLDWGGGWTFAPDGYPSGDTLFGNGSAANYGSYGPAVPGFNTNQSLINQSLSTNTSLANWENYVAKQVPDIWQPDPAFTLTEIPKNLEGVTPQNVYLNLTPEAWRWSS
ncbi:MAG TPA: ABC transporter substrate-binding protein [Acidimicrobiales bacterium]|nr:ABC transporter substrate-binding protein [Acidimicrobiales bacterium]